MDSIECIHFVRVADNNGFSCAQTCALIRIRLMVSRWNYDAFRFDLSSRAALNSIVSWSNDFLLLNVRWRFPIDSATYSAVNAKRSERSTKMKRHSKSARLAMTKSLSRSGRRLHRICTAINVPKKLGSSIDTYDWHICHLSSVCVFVNTDAYLCGVHYLHACRTGENASSNDRMRTKSVNTIFLNVATAHPYMHPRYRIHSCCFSFARFLISFRLLRAHKHTETRCYTQMATIAVVVIVAVSQDQRVRMSRSAEEENGRDAETEAAARAEIDGKRSKEKRERKKQVRINCSLAFFLFLILFRQHLLLSGCCSDSFASPLLYFCIWFFFSKIFDRFVFFVFVYKSIRCFYFSSGFYLSFVCGLVFRFSCEAPCMVWTNSNRSPRNWLVGSKRSEKWRDRLLVHLLPYFSVVPPKRTKKLITRTRTNLLGTGDIRWSHRFN